MPSTTVIPAGPVLPAAPALWRERAWLRSAWTQATLALLASRLIVWGFGLAAAHGHVGALFEQWDAVHYLHLDQHGYPAHENFEWAAFPLYPMLARGLAAGVALSTIATWLALGLIYILAEEDVGQAAARRAVWIAACFPASLFFTGYYTEGLFLCLSAAAVLAARRERPGIAAMLGADAALTRVSGVLLALPLALFSRRSPRERLLAAAGPVVGFLAFLAFAYAVTGDALAPMRVQKVWGRGFHGPFTAIVPAAHDTFTFLTGGSNPTWGYEPGWMRAYQFALVILAIVIVVGLLRRFRPAYGLYVIVSLAGPLSDYWPAHSLSSFPRYLAVVFPIYIWLGARVRGRLLALVMPLELCGLALVSWRFAAGMWAG